MSYAIPCFIIILFVLILVKYNRKENFTPISPYNIPLIDSEWMDQAPRHVKFSKGMGIMYVSNMSPTEQKCNNVKCPKYINKLITLGENNYCWEC